MSSVATNAFVATLGRIAFVGLGLGVTAVLTRWLGATVFGQYTLVLAYGSIVQLIADMGLYLTLTRQMAEHPDTAESFITHIVSLRLLLLLLTFGLAGAVVWWWPALGGAPGVFALAAIGLAAQSISQLFMGIYQVRSQVWRATIGDLGGRVVQLVVLGGVWWWLPLRLSVAVAVFSVSSLVSLGIHRWLLPTPRLLHGGMRWVVWRQLLTASWPLGLTLFLNVIYFRIDTILLNLFRSPLEVGWYGLAYRMMESGLFFPAMLGGLLLPRLSASLGKADRAQARQWLGEGIRLVVVMAGLLVALTPFLAEPLIVWLAGPGFRPAAPLFMILTLALAFMFVGNILGFTVVALHRQRWLVGLYTVLIGLNLGLNLWLIPRYGAAAAAWTTVITEAVSMVAAAVLVTRTLAFPFPAGVLLRVGGGVVLTMAGIFLFPHTWHVLVQVVLGTSLYLAWAVWLRALSKKDVALVLSSSATNV